MQSDGVVMGDHAYTIREQWHRVFFSENYISSG